MRGSNEKKKQFFKMEAEEGGCRVMELIIETDTLKMEGKLNCVNLEDTRFE